MRIAIISLFILGILSCQADAQKSAPSPDLMESRLRVAEAFLQAGDLENAEKAVVEVLKEPAVSNTIRGRSEKMLDRVLLARKAHKDNAEAIARLRLEMARALVKEGDYTQAKQVAASVLDKTDSVAVAAEAAKVYEDIQPGLGQKIIDRTLDVSKWEWLIFAALIVALLILLVFLRRALWLAVDWLVALRAALESWKTRWKLLVCIVLVIILVASVIVDWQWNWQLPQWFWGGLIGTYLVILLVWAVGPLAVPIRLGRFEDPTNSGAQSILLATLGRWVARAKTETQTSGLLLAEASRLPDVPPVTAEASGALPDLSGLPAIGGVAPGVIATALQAVWRWLLQPPYPILTGSAEVKDGEARIQLTWQPSASKIYVISAVRPGKYGKLPMQRAAESGSYQMLFILQNKSQDAADAADSVREGLELVNQYLTEFKNDALKEALGVFASVRSSLDPGEKAQLAQVHLYEGIARDLNENHDQAISHFQRAFDLGADSDFKEKAVYNKAVAQLRNLYQLAGLEASIRTLTGPELGPARLIPEDDPSAKWALGGGGAVPAKLNIAQEAKPVNAFSYAIMADAIAHFPLYWKEKPAALPAGATPAEMLQQNRERIKNAVDLVVKITTDLQGLPKSVNCGWDEISKLQLNWLIQNALGDVHLNAANCIREDTAQRDQYLKRAGEAFRQCEVMLPPGVETLSNIGTVLLVEGKRAWARDYFERAVKLNPSYEYAYYRIAQSWEEEMWREKLIETLKRIPRPPQIPELKELFQKYYVQPATGV